MSVSIVKCESYDEKQAAQALEEVMSPLGGFDFVREGMKIAVKANLVSFMKPEQAATTHPVLLAELVKKLTERGAEVTVGDSPGGLYNKAYVSRIYSATGMKAVEAAGGKLNYDFSEKAGEFADAVSARTFTYTGWLDEADIIINFSKLKTHGMMSLSAAVKNMFGAVPGTMKPEYHYRFPQPDSFADMLVDLNEYFKPRLCICDAVTGMEGNGPTAGTPRHIGALLASESPYELDLAAAGLIGLDGANVPTIAAAVRRSLSPQSLDGVEVFGDIDGFKIHDFKLVERVESLRFNRDSEKFFGRLTSRVFDRCLASRPALVKNKCIGCEKCKNICPPKAIKMVGGKHKTPKIDRGKCIRCFCCQEFCPKGALTVARPAIARMLVKQ